MELKRIFKHKNDEMIAFYRNLNTCTSFSYSNVYEKDEIKHILHEYIVHKITNFCKIINIEILSNESRKSCGILYYPLNVFDICYKMSYMNKCETIGTDNGYIKYINNLNFDKLLEDIMFFYDSIEITIEFQKLVLCNIFVEVGEFGDFDIRLYFLIRNNRGKLDSIINKNIM